MYVLMKIFLIFCGLGSDKKQKHQHTNKANWNTFSPKIKNTIEEGHKDLD